MTFDETYDVVVVGYGFAGGAAAIEAADQGASVLLIEKMPDPGGISICAGGGVRLAKNADDAFAYLNATNAGRTDEDVLRTFADEVTNLEGYLRDLASVNDAKVVVRDRPGNYPFPGLDTWGFFEVAEIPGFDPLKEYPHVRGRLGGPLVFKVVDDNVRKREIDVRMSCPAVRLIKGDDGSLRGLTVEQDGKLRNIKARRGVILASGGFEADPKMQSQYWQLAPVTSAVSQGNTGDGIRMAQEFGADLWHMWHFHGSYGFRHTDPRFPTALRMKRLPDWTPSREPPDVEMAWIVVDQDGKRYMNEYPPYGQDTGHRDMDIFDTASQTFKRIPSFVIVDEEGRKMYPLGQAVFNDRNSPGYVWSDDNLQEVDNGILSKADSLAELADIVGVKENALQATLDRWNGFCSDGEDEDFGRPSGTMVKINKPPYYVGQVWPVVSNTQGGPRHDSKQSIVNPYGEPIPRLYEAGELGSIWGYLYLVGGNLAECFISGQIAGREAANLDPWDAE
jgi:succinate dehydrogenase/fumarate reductase flavoprotein subunit